VTSKGGGHKESAWPRRHRAGDPVTILAHRGGSGPWRENSLEAFAGSLRAGADGVELDVRRGADGTLVVHHDPVIEGGGPVHELCAEELPGWVPTLATALAACADAAVNVEIKNLPSDPGYDPAHRVASDVAALLGADHGSEPWPSDVIVSSFWPETLAALRTADEDARRSHVKLGLLVHPSLDAAGVLDDALQLGCAAVHPHHSRAHPMLVRRAHELGLAVVVWTVNDPRDLDAVVRANVDVVITDQVADTVAHLA
jgi:glycerophosphoryl diester phosphodiesterase